MSVFLLPFAVVSPLCGSGQTIIAKVWGYSSEIENFSRGFQNSLGYLFREIFFPKVL